MNPILQRRWQELCAGDLLCIESETFFIAQVVMGNHTLADPDQILVFWIDLLSHLRITSFSEKYSMQFTWLTHGKQQHLAEKCDFSF